MDRLQANKSSSFDEFTTLMHKLLIAAWGKEWGSFVQAFPNGTDPRSIKLPIITFHSKSKRPGIVGKSTQEIKPRFREYYDEQGPGEPRKVNVYSQVFDHEVVFNIWTETNIEADKLSNEFENFMMTYAGYFMQNGVQQIIFLEQTDITETMQLRDNAVARSYKYLMRLEKHVEVPTNLITEIIGKVSTITESDLLNDSIDEEGIHFKN